MKYDISAKRYLAKALTKTIPEKIDPNYIHNGQEGLPLVVEAGRPLILQTHFRRTVVYVSPDDLAGITNQASADKYVADATWLVGHRWGKGDPSVQEISLPKQGRAVREILAKAYCLERKKIYTLPPHGCETCEFAATCPLKN